MKLYKGNCTKCGASLIVDRDKSREICPTCLSIYNSNEAIKHIVANGNAIEAIRKKELIIPLIIGVSSALLMFGIVIIIQLF